MKKYIKLILFIIFSSISFGEVTLEVDDDNPAVGTTFIIRVNFINEDKSEYTIDGINNFQVVSTGTNTYLSIENGKSTSSKSDVYSLLPTKEGKYKLQVKSKKGNSNAVNILVSKGKTTNVPSNKMQYVESIKDGSTFYFGEKIPYEEKFISPGSISGYRGLSQGTFNDMSAKDMTKYDQEGTYPYRRVQTANGNIVLEFTSYSGVLEANSSGDKTIKSGSVSVVDVNRRQSILGGNQINIKILPLPVEKPKNFQNVVGTISGDYSWNRDSIKLGESVVLTVKIYGSANLDQLEEIVKNSISQNDFNVFENISSSSEDIKNGKYYSEKNFAIAFVPKKSGKITVPEIEIPYFDTSKKKFENFIIRSKTINVENTNGAIPDTSQSTPAGQGNAAANTGSQNNTPSASDLTPNEEIKIETLPDVDQNEMWYNKYGRYFLGVIALETLLLLMLLAKKKKTPVSNIPLIKEMKNAKDDKAFYDMYCDLMKQKFDYTPKVHLEDRLIKKGASDALIRINREISDSIYSGKPLDRGRILRNLKKELY